MFFHCRDCLFLPLLNCTLWKKVTKLIYTQKIRSFMNMRVFLCVKLTNSEVPCAVYKKHTADCFQGFLSSAPFSLTLSQCFLLFSISLSLINSGCTGRCLSARVHKGALVFCCPRFTSWLFCTKSKQVFQTFPQ